MSKIKQGEKLVVERILMKESDKEKGTFVGKIKVFTEEKDFSGQFVVLAKNLPSDGKYKITARPMSSGKGWIVEEWEPAHDLISIIMENGEVVFCVNGRQDKLRLEDNSTIPLFFNPAKYFPPEIILKNIRKKLEYLSLAPDFNFEEMSSFFLARCAEVEKLHKKNIKHSVQSVDDEVDLSKLLGKYGKN